MIKVRMKSIAGALACAAVIALGSQASADTRVRDRVYADSFGNLVIHSAAGYKRIVVGEGHLAKELGAYTGSDEPAIVEYEPGRIVVRDCPAVLLKGRSYMYGLPDHVVPQPALDYCD